MGTEQAYMERDALREIVVERDAQITKLEKQNERVWDACEMAIGMYERIADKYEPNREPQSTLAALRDIAERALNGKESSGMVVARLTDELATANKQIEHLKLSDAVWEAMAKDSGRRCDTAQKEVKKQYRARDILRTALQQERNKTFPIQRSREYGKPHPLAVPWSIAELAYSVYSSLYHGQTLERLAERGGFAPQEMDEYYPGWIECCSEITQIKAVLTAANARTAAYKRDVAEISKSHAELALGVKAALGFENWPKFDGPFNKAVGAFVAMRIAELEAKLKPKRHPDLWFCDRCGYQTGGGTICSRCGHPRTKDDPSH
jgi:hypothetical protein